MNRNAALSPTGLRLLDRRSFLGHLGGGLGSVALLHMLAAQGALGADDGDDDNSPIRPDIDPAHPHAPLQKMSSTRFAFAAKWLSRGAWG